MGAGFMQCDALMRCKLARGDRAPATLADDDNHRAGFDALVKDKFHALAFLLLERICAGDLPASRSYSHKATEAAITSATERAPGLRPYR